MHKNIRLLTLFEFFLGFRFYTAVGIIYFIHITGSYALALLIYSIVSITSTVFEVPTGILSDRIGRKKTIVLGAFFNLGAIIFYSVGQSFFILTIGSILYGISSSLFSGNNEALLFDSTRGSDKASNYGKYIGIIKSMSQFGPAIAGIIGGFLANWSFVYLMWISVVPQLCCLVITLFIIEPKVHSEKISSNIFSDLRMAVLKFKNNPKLRTLSLASIIEFGIGETMYSFTPAFIATLWPLWAVGIARSFNNLCGTAGYLLAGKVMKKFSATRSMLWGEIVCSVLALIAVIFPTVLTPILYGLASIPYGINNVARDTLMQFEFTQEQRATMGSLNTLFGNLFFALFAFLFGFIADRVAANQALLTGEVLLLSLIYLYWKLFKNFKKLDYGF